MPKQAKAKIFYYKPTGNISFSILLRKFYGYILYNYLLLPRLIRWFSSPREALFTESGLTIVSTEEKVKKLFYYMNFVKLVFEEHICRINHKKTSMTLSATSRIWRETSRSLYLPRMTSSEVAIALYFLPNRGLSQSERGEI